jgi:hypothetical protein
MAPEYLSPRPVEWFKYNRQDQDSGNGIGRGAPTGTTKAALRERRNVFQSSLISLDRAHQHANAPHPLRLLLRPRRQRTRGRRAAQKSDEVAPFHCLMLPVLSDSTSVTAQGCCAAAFQSSLCRRWVLAV